MEKDSKVLAFSLATPSTPELKAAAELVSMPGNCAVVVDHVDEAALKPALESVLAPLAGASDIPEVQRPAADGLTFWFARQVRLPGLADARPARIFLISRPRGAEGAAHMLMLARPMP